MSWSVSSTASAPARAAAAAISPTVPVPSEYVEWQCTTQARSTGADTSDSLAGDGLRNGRAGRLPPGAGAGRGLDHVAPRRSPRRAARGRRRLSPPRRRARAGPCDPHRRPGLHPVSGDVRVPRGRQVRQPLRERPQPPRRRAVRRLRGRPPHARVGADHPRGLSPGAVLRPAHRPRRREGRQPLRQGRVPHPAQRADLRRLGARRRRLPVLRPAPRPGPPHAPRRRRPRAAVPPGQAGRATQGARHVPLRPPHPVGLVRPRRHGRRRPRASDRDRRHGRAGRRPGLRRHPRPHRRQPVAMREHAGRDLGQLRERRRRRLLAPAPLDHPRRPPLGRVLRPRGGDERQHARGLGRPVRRHGAREGAGRRQPPRPPLAQHLPLQRARPAAPPVAGPAHLRLRRDQLRADRVASDWPRRSAAGTGTG